MSKHNRIVILFVLVSLLLSACQPIQPAARGASAATPLAVTAALNTPLEEALAGKYEGTTVAMGGIYGGSWFADYWKAIKEFEKKTGITVGYSSITQEDPAFLASLGTDKGPDIVEFTYVSPIRDLAKAGKVVDLNQWMDPAALQERYPQNWLDWATMEGPKGPVMAAIWSWYWLDSVVWYPKEAFDAAGYKVPTTWDEMLALSDQIVADGGTPWCINNGWGSGADGYSLAQWIGDILLRTAPPEVSDQWMSGALKSDSPEVKHAIEVLTDLFFKPGYVLGGREAINKTTIYKASHALLSDPPKCWMLKIPTWALDFDGDGDFTAFDFKEFGKDYAYFVLPPIDAEYGAPLQVEAHLAAMFRDRPEVRALMEFLATGVVDETWIKLGHHLGVSPHMATLRAWYPDPRAQALAETSIAAQEAGTQRYIASEGMPLRPNLQLYKSMNDFIAGTIDLDTALQQIDAAWSEESAAPAAATAETAATATPVPVAQADAAQPTPTPGKAPRVSQESFTIESQALAGNLYGDQTQRDVYVLLPPSYAKSDRRYPALYVIPRYDGDAKSLAYNFGVALNSLLRQGGSSNLIVVVPDGKNAFGIGQFRSSPVLGVYETYLTQEVLNYVDAHYRTLIERDSRGIAGCEPGGAAAMRLALRHPDLYGAVASAGGIYDEALDLWPSDVKYVEGLARVPERFGDWFDNSTEDWYYYAAAEAAPNPDNQPFQFDPPMRMVDGHAEFVPEVVDKIVANDSMHAAQEYVKQPLRLNGIYIMQSLGDPDPGMIAPAESFDSHLTELGIEHEYVPVEAEGLRCPTVWNETLVDYMQEKLVAE